MIAEQLVAQHLAYLPRFAAGPDLYNWLRDKGTQKSEVDFLIEKDQQIFPVEVKSTSSGHLKSLFYFLSERKKSIGIKLSLEKFSKDKVRHQVKGELIEAGLISLPIWPVEALYDIVSPRENSKTR